MSTRIQQRRNAPGDEPLFTAEDWTMIRTYVKPML